MQTGTSALRTTARITGLLYFFVAVLGAFGYFFIGSRLTIEGDGVASAEKMVSREALFRTGIIMSIITNILFLTTIIFLYRLLKRVNETQAKLMVWFAVIAIPVLFIVEAIQFTALFISKGELLKSFQPQQGKEIAASLLDFSNNTSQMITFHWGLWLIPLGWLVYKSGFIPKIFGVLLWINGLGFIVVSTTFILWPGSLETVSKIVMPAYFMGELPLIGWLLVKGVKNKYA